MSRPLNRALALTATAVLTVGLAGCSSTDPVPQEDVESQISSQLEEEVGQAPDDVSCPDDLEAEEDATMECTLTAGEDELGVTVTVNSVEDGEVRFDIEVDDQAQ